MFTTPARFGLFACACACGYVCVSVGFGGECVDERCVCRESCPTSACVRVSVFFAPMFRQLSSWSRRTRRCIILARECKQIDFRPCDGGGAREHTSKTARRGVNGIGNTYDIVRG